MTTEARPVSRRRQHVRLLAVAAAAWLIIITVPYRLAIVREHGVTHLLIDRRRLAAWLDMFRLTRPAFLASHADLEEAGNGIVLYRLRPPPPRGGQP